MSTLIGKIIAAVGAILTGVSLFLPWVEITNSSFVSRALDALTILAVADMPYITALIQGLNQLLQRPIAEMSMIMGTDIAFRLSFTDSITKGLVLLPATIGLMAFLTLVIGIINAGLSRILGFTSSTFAIISLIAVLLGRSRIERMGISPKVPDQIVALAGAEVRMGYWIAIIGLALISVGFVLNLFNQPQITDELDYFYP